MKLPNIYGCILTNPDDAANNRGENTGNISQMQRVTIKNKDYTRVSSESIRLGILKTIIMNNADRTNRQWDNASGISSWSDERDPEKYLDDDLFGFMTAEAAREEGELDEQGNKQPAKGKRAKGKSIARRSCVEINAAISTAAFKRETTFNATSAKKLDDKGNANKTSLYGTERHFTSYQWGFAINPYSMVKPGRILTILDAIAHLGSVAGNHARFKYDFAPNLVALRVTHDFSPRIFKIFEAEDLYDVKAKKLIKYAKYGEIQPGELYVGGELNEGDMEELSQLGVSCFPTPRMAFKAVNKVIESLLDS